MKRFALLPLLACVACSSAPVDTAPAAAPAPQGPFGVVLFIGDGTGVAYWSAARHATSSLAIGEFHTLGLVDTRSSNSRVTDSAAGATAFSAGLKTFNGAIGVAPDSSPVETVLEVAESRGMSTGLVVTSTITHATPASFVAHVPDRNMHEEIARQIADSDVDVLLGGGRQFFDPAQRDDSLDLLTPLRRKGTYVDTPAAFDALRLDTVRTLIGLFAEENPPAAADRRPSLPDMTTAALRVLERNQRGFFLMVEGSQIDWRGHDNAPLQDVIAEVLDLDMAIRQALIFRQRRPNTLVLVVADHSTGGLALQYGEDGRFGAHYTTEAHTGEMIPLFAAGPGAEAFAGLIDNDQVGRLLLEMVERGGPTDRRARADNSDGN
jgi:alkaline phosphatase